MDDLTRESVPLGSTRMGKKLVRGVTAFVVLSAAGLTLLFALPGEDIPLSSVAELRPGFALAAIVCALADLPLGAVRYHIFLRRVKRGVSMWLPIRAEMATRFSGAVTPSQSGGGPAQLLIFHQGGVPVPEALSVLAINFMTNIVFFLVGGSAAAGLLADRLPPGTGGLLVVYGFVSFLAAVAVMGILVLRPRWMAAALEWLLERLRTARSRWAAATSKGARALLGICERYTESCERFVRQAPGLIAGSLALAAVVNLNRATVGWLLVRAMGIPAAYGTTVALLVLLQFALYLVPTPGGSGIAELGTGALMSLVLPTPLLGPFALAYRCMLTYLPATAGAFVLVSALRTVVRRRRAEAPLAAGLVLLVALALSGTARGADAAQRLGVASPGPGSAASVAGDTVPASSGRAPGPPPLVLSPLAGSAACPSSLLPAARTALVSGMALSDEDAARAAFSRAEELAREAAACDPASAEARYLLAAALGLHLDRTGIRTKARMVGETRDAAEAALALDPSHPGAHHILGRLHAGAMRLGSVERFVARRFLGGRFLDEASWERAEEHFRRAREAEPDNPRHSLELGTVYLDTDRPSLARAELARAAALPVRLPEDSAVVARARALLDGLGGSPSSRDTDGGIPPAMAPPHSPPDLPAGGPSGGSSDPRLLHPDTRNDHERRR